MVILISQILGIYRQNSPKINKKKKFKFSRHSFSSWNLNKAKTMKDYILELLTDSFFLDGPGIAVFIILNTLLTLVCFPAWCLTLSSGFLYGTLPGLVYQLIAITLSTCISYYFGAKINSRNKKSGRFSQKFKDIFNSKGIDSLILIFLLKINPIVPFTPIIIYLGHIKYSLPKLLSACLLASIPLNYLYALIGNSLSDLTLLITMNQSDVLGSDAIFYLCLTVIATLFSVYLCIRISSKITGKIDEADK
jgi:uncharacterized membrane protein YdjX (TVP38/TMEM64 family)